MDKLFAPAFIPPNTTSNNGKKCSSPMCPLFGGSTVVLKFRKNVRGIHTHKGVLYRRSGKYHTILPHLLEGRQSEVECDSYCVVAVAGSGEEGRRSEE